MKKYNILWLFIALFSLSACNNFLDIKPVGKVIPTNVDEYRAFLARAYKAIPSDRGMVNFRSDEMMVRDDEYDKQSYAYLEIWDDNSTLASNASFDWINYYSIVYKCNQIIEKGRSITLVGDATVSDVDQLIGEAYMLRGYVYYLLVNIYGQPYTFDGALNSKAVPLILDTDIEKVHSRSLVKDIYASILSDIESARKLITKDKWEVIFSYRFNSASVEAFAARMNLYMGNWKESLDAAKKVLSSGYILEDLTKEESKLPNQFESTESIVALEMVMSSNVTRASIVSEVCQSWYHEEEDKRFGKYFSVKEEKVEKEPTHELEEGEEPEYDIIRTVTPIKGGKNEFSSTFRLGEFVITAAEASAQLGMLDEAKGYINQLAAKRYTEEGQKRISTEIAGMAKEQLIAFIGTERARELAFEGHRWFDLRRTTRSELVKVIDGKTYTLKKDDARYVVPIPREAISANPNLAN